MSARYLWWRSCYDGVLHAFPVIPEAPLLHQHYRASCAHAAPPDLAGEVQDGPRCPLCLIITRAGETV
jgi:hypothetical protein